MEHASGKRGGRGRGSFGRDQGPKNKKGYLDENTMTYYRRVSDTLSEFQDKNDEEKSIFLNNAFTILTEEVVKVAQNQTVSTIIESLIAVASPSNLRVLFVAAVSDLTVAFLDRFASHVFESLVQKLPLFFNQPTHGAEDDEEDDVSQDVFLESFETVCQFVDSHFETLVTHVYGSHVLRALLEALSGVPVAHELKKSQRSGYGRKGKDQVAPVQKTGLPEEFKPLFDKYTEMLFRTCDYEVHLKDPFFSLLMQAVLMMWQKTESKLCQKHCKKILHRVVKTCASPETDKPQDRIPDVAQDTVGSHLLEVIFKLSCVEILQEVFDTLLQGKLLYYAIHPVANYVLQSFISAVKEKAVMESLFDELCKNMEDVLAVGHLGLVTCLAESCQRLRLKQDELIVTLMEAFHCKEPEERQKSLAKLLASLTTYDVFFKLDAETGKPSEGAEEVKLKGPINIHGSLLLQQLLQFQKPKDAALGILAMQPEELQVLCCDPSGSHIVDVYFSASTVLEKNKDIFLKKMKGLLVDTACNRNGSRCLESVWKNLGVKNRTKVAEELAESDRLRSDRFGHFLFYNFSLALFSADRKLWLERQGVESKRKRMMKELLHSAESPAKKQKGGTQDVITQEEEDGEEDSVTAMFMKHKKDNHTKQQARKQKGSEDECDDDESPPLRTKQQHHITGEKQKKKKKKDKAKALANELCESEEESESLVKQEKEKAKRKKGKRKAVCVLVAQVLESEEDSSIPKRKKSKVKDKKEHATDKKMKKTKKRQTVN